jgi:hypothetical protein
MSAREMFVETLKKSLAANGLAQYGTKEQMLHRLLTGGNREEEARPQAQG